MKFLKTISVKELREILDSVKIIDLEVEELPLDECFNRVFARDIKSNINVPHFRKSRMDGYAVIAEDTFTAEENNFVTLELVEQIQAGDSPQNTIKKGQCSYVATGAAVPDGADAVVMVEFSNLDGNNVIISNGVTPGTHVINIGHDVNLGDTICKKNTLIDLPTIGLLSACGIRVIPVYKKPIISLLSTGNEIVSPDVKNLDIGQIYDVNSNVLKIAIKKVGADVQHLGIILDEFKKLKDGIDKGIEVSDIVILSGGTSKGEGDFGPKVVEEYQNIEIMVHGVRMKPGKPLIFSKIGEKIIFILPGYPTSALSCFYVFIENFIRRMARLPLKEKKSMILEVAERIYSTVGRYEFKPVKFQVKDGIKKISPIQTGSEAISTLFYADGYIEIEELEGIVEKGDMRKVFLF